LIFRLTLSHALLLFPLSSKFSRAADLFLIVTCICVLCSLLAHCQPHPHFCSYQIVVSITVSFCQRLDIKYTRILSSVLGNVISLVVCLSHRRCAAVFMNVVMRECCTFHSYVFGCGKVFYSNSIVITDFVWTLVPGCQFGMSSLPTFALKSHNKFFIFYQGN
jgi:hypothetical protein